MSSFLSSDQVKFSAPLPSLEFKDQDISTPFLAARLIYDVDFLHDRKEVVLWILEDVFRKNERVLPIVKRIGRAFLDGHGQQFLRAKVLENRGLPSHTRRQTLKATSLGFRRKKETQTLKRSRVQGIPEQLAWPRHIILSFEAVLA